jgi:hypothetical protein
MWIDLDRQSAHEFHSQKTNKGMGRRGLKQVHIPLACNFEYTQICDCLLRVTSSVLLAVATASAPVFLGVPPTLKVGRKKANLSLNSCD